MKVVLRAAVRVAARLAAAAADALVLDAPPLELSKVEPKEVQESHPRAARSNVESRADA